MGSLSNLYISQSYKSLAHLGTDDALVPGQMTMLQDGIGQSLNISFDGTNISSSGNIYAANITASVVNTGSLVTTSSFNSYTQSTNIRLNNLENTSASVNISITNLNASSASQQVSIDALNVFTASQSTASLVTSITELNTFSASAKVSINNLNAATSSYVTETESGSFLITASFNNGTRNLTFTKGDNTTFAVNIPDVSGSIINTGSFVTNIAATTNPLAFEFTSGNGGQTEVTLLLDTGSFATTGSNTFNGQQIIQDNSLAIYGQYPGINLQANANGSGSQYPNMQIVLDSATYSGDGFIGGYGTSDSATGASVAIGINGYSTRYNFPNPVPMIYGQGNLFSDVDDTLIGFPAGRVDIFRKTNISDSLTVTGSFTASLQEGYVWVGNSSGITSLVATSSFGSTINTGSFATTGSNSFNGNQTITGSLNVKTITTLETGITPSSPNAAAGGTQLNFLYGEYNNGAKPSIENIQPGWVISGAGITDGTVTNAYFDFDGYRVDITSGNVVSGSSYTGAGPYTPQLIITGGAYSDSGFTSANSFVIATQTGGGVQYGGIGIVPTNATTPTDCFNSFYIAGTTAESRIQVALSSYTSQHPGEPVPTIYAGGYYNGSDTTITFYSSSIEMWMPTIAKAGFSVTGSTNIENLTASLTNGYVWVGDSNNRTTLVPTSSFGGGGISGNYATTGSNFFNGNQVITGSLFVSGALNTTQDITIWDSTLNPRIKIGRGGGNQNSNLRFGIDALENNTTGNTNLAIGNSALQYLSASSAFGNVAIGNEALLYNQADQNVAIGMEALRNNRTGGNNFALGSFSLNSNTTGGENVAIGTGALNKNIAGSRNVALGGGALFGNVNGNFNIGIGYNTGELLSGSKNVLIGYRAASNFSGSTNVIIGGYQGVGETINNNIILADGDGNIKAHYNSNAEWELTNTRISGSFYIDSSSAFPQSTGSAIVTWNGTTGQLSHATPKSILPALFDVGYFYSTTTQSGSANQSGSFQFDATAPINEITLTSGSHINIPTSAWYNFQFSVQIVNGASSADVAVWLKKNGNNVADTATYITVPSNQKSVLALNIWDSASAGDYYELAYQSNQPNTTYATIGATGNIPASPSVILSVNQVR